jgi:hypothetical protein
MPDIKDITKSTIVDGDLYPVDGEALFTALSLKANLSGGNTWSGVQSFGATINTGAGVSTGDVAFEHGKDRTGDGNVYHDLHAVAGGDYSARLYRASGANGNLSLINTGTGIIYYEQIGSGPHVFKTNGVERGRFTEGGSLLIGTTTATAKFTVVSSQNSAYIENAVATNFTMRVVNTGASGDRYLILFETDTNSQRGSITYNGTSGLIQYNVNSDYRVKDIYGPLENSGETIDAIKIYRGKMHGASIECPMVIAHEAQVVVPYCVTGEKDAVHENGTLDLQQVNYSALVPLMIAEIQSLRLRVAQLEEIK